MLTYLDICGGPIDIGRALGRFGRQAVHDYLCHSTAWASIMQWRDSHIAHQLHRHIELHFPAIALELRGLAQGLDLPEQDVVLWNCRGDLWAMAPDGCTTVLLPGPSQPRITHNEDGDPNFRGHCGIARISPDDGPGFVSFVYPGSIPGHTFAVNQHGVAMTVNNLRWRQVTAGVPRMVITRALLNQPGLAQITAMLQAGSWSGGFHLSIAQAGQSRLLSIEFGAAGVSIQDIRRPSLHANHAVHPALAHAPQRITASSDHRQQRGDALIAQAGTDGPDPLAILRDTHDTEWPILRLSPDDSDQENTLATADLHVGSHGVRWEVYTPGQATPVFRFEGTRRLQA